MTPAIITAAICGAETTREMTPHLPITADELAEEAARCREAGASVVHLHVRKDDGTPTQDRALFQKALDAIRGRTDVIVQTSTGGAVGMSADERAQPLDCTPPPEMATLNAGSLNFGDDVFLNPFPLVRDFAGRMRARGIAYELECYDVGHVEACLRLAQEGVIQLPAHFDFVMGVRGGIQASEDNLTFLVMKLPRGCTFRPRCPHAFNKCTDEPDLVNRVEEPGHVDRCWLSVQEKRDARDRTIRGEEEEAA